MDPNEALRRIDDFLIGMLTGTQVDIWCECLHQWIGKGGFAPDWGKYELGTAYYKCRKISMDKSDYTPVG